MGSSDRSKLTAIPVPVSFETVAVRCLLANLGQQYGPDELTTALLISAMKLRYGLHWTATEDISEFLSIDHPTYDKLPKYKLKKIMTDLTMGLGFQVSSLCREIRVQY